MSSREEALARIAADPEKSRSFTAEKEYTAYLLKRFRKMADDGESFGVHWNTPRPLTIARAKAMWPAWFEPASEWNKIA